MTEPRPQVAVTTPKKADEGPTISVPNPEPETKSEALLAANEAPSAPSPRMPVQFVPDLAPCQSEHVREIIVGHRTERIRRLA